MSKNILIINSYIEISVPFFNLETNSYTFLRYNKNKDSGNSLIKKKIKINYL